MDETAVLREIHFPEWMNQAACGDLDPEDFFPKITQGRGSEARIARRTATAKAVCAACPVRTECLEYALESDSQYGVWGGLDEVERRSLRRRTPWSRP